MREAVTPGSPNTGTVISDATARFDEGGFNFETRRRVNPGTDSPADPLTQRKFDWAGNVTEECSFGDAATEPQDRIVSFFYDSANRLARTTNSLGGETIYDRDNRGNATQLQVKLNDRAYALTDMIYDALSRVTRITDPQDAGGQRHYRQRFYDSRGHLLRETAYAAGGGAQQATVWSYDEIGCLEYQAVLANPNGTALAGRGVDRVVDYEYEDADGRLSYRKTYNRGSTAPLTSQTTYYNIGRVESSCDPAGHHTTNTYAADGHVQQREIEDGVGTRSITFTYDGHDRVETQTASGGRGVPSLVTTYAYDACDRPTHVTNPKGIVTRTDYDALGQPTAVVENVGGGLLEQQTSYDYDQFGQLVGHTANNHGSTGGSPAAQLTSYRWDPFGHLLSITYPGGAGDSVQMTYDVAGRIETRQDQRGLTTTYDHDDRGLMTGRTTGRSVETFGYDALGRLTHAARDGTVIDRHYTPLGYVDYEDQSIAGRATRRVDYAHDQAGNVTQLAYPGGFSLGFTPTDLNKVHTITAGGSPLVEYGYYGGGRLPEYRRTTTVASGSTTVYDTGFGYDAHRRTSLIDNILEIGGTPEAVASYAFTHDLAGNPLSQVAGGRPDFAGDDRTFTVDNLNRLGGTMYQEFGTADAATFDLLGNRETHTDRAGEFTQYGPVNAVNEYSTIAGVPVTYDAAGNLATDEDGRQYFYDEQNRLVEVRDAGSATLAEYEYDALGRRVSATIGGATTLYYYDGQRVIEERDAADAVARYHVDGGQFIDEHIATYDVAKARASAPRAAEPRPSGSGQDVDRAAGWTYYLLNANYSIAGSGNADGSVIQRLDYTSSGDFPGGGGPQDVYAHDADLDGDIDLTDFASLQECFDLVDPGCLAAHDYDAAGQSDGEIDLADVEGFAQCFNGPDVPPPAGAGHDWEPDGDVDLADVAEFQVCYGTTDPDCLAVFDFDAGGQSDGVVWFSDFDGLISRLNGPGNPPAGECPVVGRGADDPVGGRRVAGQNGSAPEEYEWYYDLALFYDLQGTLYRAVWDEWRWNESQYWEYDRSQRREFVYDSARALFAVQDATAVSDFAYDYWEYEWPARYTDYLGDQPWGEWEHSFELVEPTEPPWEYHYETSQAETMRYLTGMGAQAWQTLAESEPRPSGSGPGSVGSPCPTDDPRSAGGDREYVVTDTRYLHGDLIRSTMMLTDETGAAVSSGVGIPPAVSYTAFGEPLPANSAIDRYGYAGGWGYDSGMLSVSGANPNLPAISLQHVGARWYDPALGRFVQRDPIGIRGGSNAYAYCAGKPLTAVDPLGASSWWPWEWKRPTQAAGIAILTGFVLLWGYDQYMDQQDAIRDREAEQLLRRAVELDMTLNRDCIRLDSWRKLGKQGLYDDVFYIPMGDGRVSVTYRREGKTQQFHFPLDSDLIDY